MTSELVAPTSTYYPDVPGGAVLIDMAAALAEPSPPLPVSTIIIITKGTPCKTNQL